VLVWIVASGHHFFGAATANTYAAVAQKVLTWATRSRSDFMVPAF
jgi:hypothetical protein